MEEGGTMVAKKVWSMVRALYFMLRKDKSNKKIILDLKMMMKRGKLARKAFLSLMLNHHNKDSIVHSSSDVLPGEYIFSCSDTPLFRRNGSTSHRFFSCAHAPPTMEDGDEMSVNVAVIKALEMLQSDRQEVTLRITEDICVDKAAEEFIRKFYKDLNKQT